MNRNNRTVRIPVNQEEKYIFQSRCREYNTNESDEVKRLCTMYLKDMDVEYSSTGCIQFTFSEPWLVKKPTAFIQVYVIEDNYNRLAKYSEMCGMSIPALCRFIILPALRR